MSQHQAVALFAAITLFCIFQAMFWTVRGRRRRKEELLRSRLRGGGEAGGGNVNIMRQGVGQISDSLARFRMMRRLAAALVQGGYSVTVSQFLLRVSAIVGGVLVLVVALTRSAASGILLAAVTGLAIYYLVSRRRQNRLRQIDQQLPKALELMMFGLRAGHSLEDTIRFAANELVPPLAVELKRCHEEYELGRPIEDSLLGLSMRLEPCKALRTFVEAVLVLKQTGGNLIEIIEQIIDVLRAQAAYESRYRALTAEGRTSGLILGTLPLLILAAVALVQPSYLASLISDPAGWKVLAIAGTLWSVGILWLMRLVRPAI